MPILRLLSKSLEFTPIHLSIIVVAFVGTPLFNFIDEVEKVKRAGLLTDHGIEGVVGKVIQTRQYEQLRGMREWVRERTGL